MFPKEHGAYGQLIFPLVAALAIGHPSLAAVAFALSAVAVFLAHEPLLVLLGQRGLRAERDLSAQAWRWFGGAASAAVLLGAYAAWAMPHLARLTLAGPLVLGLAVAVVVALHHEHTTEGEIVTSIAFASLAVPTAVASGVPLRAASTCALVFAVCFVSATVCVRAVILWAKKQGGVGMRAGSAGIVVALVAWLIYSGLRGDLVLAGVWATLPVCGVAVALAAAPPSPKHLKKVGWTLVGATLLTTALVIALLGA